MATWEFIATDLRTNTRLGTLPLTGVRFGEVLNGAGTFTATLPLAGVAAASSSTTTAIGSFLTSASIPGRTAIWFVREGVPVGAAIVWTRRRQKGRPAQLGGASLWSMFRLAHLRTTLSYAATDQLTIARAIIAAAQAVPGGDIGVTPGVETSGVLRDRIYNSYDLKQIAEAVEQLAAVNNGFDFAIDVTTAYGKVLTLSYPRRGRIAGTTGLAFVDGKNLLDYTVDEDDTRSARTFTALGAGDGPEMLVSTSTRTDLIDVGYPATSAVGSYKDVSVRATLDAHAAAGVNARATTPTFWKVTVDPDDIDGGLGTFITGDDALLDIPNDDNFPQQADGTSGYRRFHRIIGYEVTPASDGGKDLVTIELGDI